MINFHQFFHIVEQLDRDCEYIENKIKTENLPEDTNYFDFNSELPSQRAINVGITVKYSKKHIRDFIKNGLFCHSENVKFTHILYDIPMEVQTPFDIIVCKLVDCYHDFLEGKKVEQVEILRKHTEEYKDDSNPNGILILDGPEKMRNLFLRKLIHDTANEVFESTYIQDLCKEYNKTIKRPKTILLTPSQNANVNLDAGVFPIEDEIKAAGLSYPVIIKTDRTFITPFSHAKYFVPDPSSLDKNPFATLYENVDMLAEDIVVEELISHQEHSLFKIHFMGDQFMFSRIDNSIPKSFFKEFTYIGHKSDVSTEMFDKPKEDEGESKCSKFDKLDTNEEFLFKVGAELMRKFEVTFAGFDFILSDDGNEFTLIDANYFTLYKRCNLDNVKVCFNECLENLVKRNREL